MLSFPNGKINLGLHIVGKREDGYHNIETVFYPFPIHDVVEIIRSEKFTISISGSAVEGNAHDNLCVKAYLLLKDNFPQISPVNIYLHKSIPIGAGLGGGSADGAFTLMLLNRLFQLNLSTGQLIGYASQLGSDCPFFIVNKPSFASGRGEILKEIQLDLSGYSFLLVHPDIHIHTSWAFSQPRISEKYSSIKEIIAQPIFTWKEKLANDFEKVVFEKYPELKIIKEQLYSAGALYASMTGSGSAFYGIFEKNNIPSISFENNFGVFAIK